MWHPNLYAAERYTHKLNPGVYYILVFQIPTLYSENFPRHVRRIHSSLSIVKFPYLANFPALYYISAVLSPAYVIPEIWSESRAGRTA
jgi:hypothetical protein